MLVPLQTLVEINGPEILSSRDEKGNTVAHWCCLGGHVTLLRYLIELKAPVDEYSTEDPYAKPIHWACVNGHIAILEILLQFGISIDSQDSKGCTPLIYASQYGQTTLAGYLIGKGAQLHICDKDGDTALHWAAFKGRKTFSIVPKNFLTNLFYVIIRELVDIYIILSIFCNLLFFKATVS